MRRWRWFCAALVACLVGIPVGATDLGLQLVSRRDASSPPINGGAGNSAGAILSDDGRIVVFASEAANLIKTTNSGAAQFLSWMNVYAYDRGSNVLSLVSANSLGNAGGSGDSFPIDLSADGRYVLFQSAAKDIVSKDTNLWDGLFIRDLVNGKTIPVNIQTNGWSTGFGFPGMSRDGRYVVFSAGYDVLVRDVQESKTVASATGRRPDGSFGSAPVISADGRYVAYLTSLNNNSSLNARGIHVLLNELATGKTVWVSQSTSNYFRYPFEMAFCFDLSVSRDGRYVAYSASTWYGSSFVFRYDAVNDTTVQVCTNAFASTNGFPGIEHNLSMTPDGESIAYVAVSSAPNSPSLATCVNLWEAATGTTKTISATSNGVPSTNAICASPQIDATGQHVAYLGTDATNGNYHLYLYDKTADITEVMDDTNAEHGLSLGSAAAFSMTPDAGLIAFAASDSSLVTNNHSPNSDVYVRDINAAKVELVSKHDPAIPRLAGDGSSIVGSVSGNGEYVAFASDADDLVPGDTNHCTDVFVRNIIDGSVVLVSRGLGGECANGSSGDVVISRDGGFVAFTSTASNLVTNDLNREEDVFVADLRSGQITLVSELYPKSSPRNGSTPFGPSYSPSISIDGRFVMFRSMAYNILPNNRQGEYVYVRDLQSATTTLVTIYGSVEAAMSPDGNYVAYKDHATGTNAVMTVWDRRLSAGIFTNMFVYNTAFAFSGDGTKLAYLARDGGVLLLDLNTMTQGVVANGPYRSICVDADGSYIAMGNVAPSTAVYICDTKSKNMLLVTHAWNSSAVVSGFSDGVQISADGRFVAYRCNAANITEGTTTSEYRYYIYDLLTGTNTLIAPGQLTVPRQLAPPIMSFDGSTLIVQGPALTFGMGDYNNATDLYACQPVSAMRSIVRRSYSQNGFAIGIPFAAYGKVKIQYKNSLNDPTWTDLVGTVTSNLFMITVRDPEKAPQRYYRVVTW